ncbi:virulence factor TspB C-terminal domain-related protein [Acinetobacter baumannii]|uniref:virulence factor TspB C-terminal domain-related protein n=2 Tax=Acinetobacter baumannii TaxID=470 RepID=UPI002341C862|nr:virulence factor TspB C-terminal domain-related protein [Acinetobacter baumannii]
MVNRLCFRNLRIDNFKLITWLQIFIIAITPNFIFFQSANAITVAGEGWSVTKTLVQGATTFYDGTKNILLNGKSYAAKGSAFIIPNATQIGKMIVKTGAVFAVDLAIKALIGAVDYVMEPENNRVKYYGMIQAFQSNSPYNGSVKVAKSQAEACQISVDFVKSNTSANYSSVTLGGAALSGTSLECKILAYRSGNNTPLVFLHYWTLTGVKDDQPKYLPYEAIGYQLISDANANKSDAKAYVSSVADTALEQDEQKQLVPAQDIINQLEYNKTIPTTETAQGQSTPQADPNDPTAPKAPPTDITLNFPVFCEWAPTVCQAAQAAIDFPKTVADYWKKTDKWMNESASDTSETKPEVKELELNFDDGSRINFDQTCPQPQPIQVTFMGVTQDASFSFEPLCNFMIMIRPFVIGSAYLIGAYIVMGLSRGNSE